MPSVIPGAARSRSPLVFLFAMLAVVTSDAAAGPPALAAGDVRHVIHISIDGLATRFLEQLLGEGKLPNFKRLQNEGAWTHNARTDFDYTITLPNHTCMVTGRPVKDKAASPAAIAGHQWVVNTDPGDKTIHSNRHDYVQSAFDVAHDHGLRTALFASKSKFVLYDQSYDARSGAPDTAGEDNGRDKIDLYVKDSNSSALLDRFIEEMRTQPLHYAFVHFHDCDSAGHAKTWGSLEYLEALKKVDGYLGRMLGLVTTDERFKGQTALILSADHGGTGLDHGFNTNPLNFVIPFYVWGASIAHDDLYSLNASTRVDPREGRPDYTEQGRQPIRNGDGGNLALKLLGLPAIGASVINAAQDLNVR